MLYNIFLLIVFGMLVISFIQSPLKAILMTIIWYPTLIMFKVGGFFTVVSIFCIFMITYMIIEKVPFKFRDFPWKYSFLLCISSYMLTFLFSPSGFHPTEIPGYIHIFIMPYLVWRFYTPKEKIRRFFIFNMSIYLFILSLYGIYENSIGRNPFIEYLNNIHVISYVNHEGWRHGIENSIQSITIWGEVTGYICTISIAYILHCIFLKIQKPYLILYILLGLLTVCSFLCGFRSIIVTLTITLCSFFPYIKSRFKYFLPLLIIAFLLLDNFSDIANEMLSSIINHESSKGSTFESRTLQFGMAMQLTQKNPFIGSGIAMMQQYQEQNRNILYGLESIIFTTSISRGFLGLVSILFLWLQSLYIFAKRKHYELCIIMLAFIFLKTATLVYTIDETHALLFLIPLMIEMDYLKKNKVQLEVSKRK
jgi:hypothetical protein